MKPTTLILTFTSLLSLTLATPLPSEIFALESRAGPYCHTLLPDPTPCRYGAGYSYDQKRPVKHTENVGGICKAYDVPQ